MRFMVMHKTDARMEAGGPPPIGIIEAMGQFIQGALKAGVFKNGAGLHPSSRRVRLRFHAGGRTITRGPFAGDNELLASFAIVRAASIDHAIEVATRIAAVLGDVEIEIGPIVEPWDIGVMARPADPPLRFLLLRKADRDSESGAAERAGLQPVMDELAREGVLESAATLAPSARGARYRKIGGTRGWTDGPFTESKELVAGFSIIEVPSQAEARAWAEAYAVILGDNEVDVRVVVGGG
jgi:hypothetical protein